MLQNFARSISDKLTLDIVRWKEVLIILELELLIFIECDFSREVNIPVEVVDCNVHITLFFSVVSSAEINLVRNILFAIIKVVFLGEAKGESTLLGSGEDDWSDTWGKALRYEVVESIEIICFANELNDDFLGWIWSTDKDFPFDVFDVEICGHYGWEEGQDHQPNKEVFFIEHKSNLNTKDINLI